MINLSSIGLNLERCRKLPILKKFDLCCKFKPLTSDIFQSVNSNKSVEVKVFNSLDGLLKKGEKLVSPEFNGCHGVAVYNSTGAFSFHHFPPFAKNKLIENLKESVKKMSDDGAVDVVFISPMSKKGATESAFIEYEKIIKDKFFNPSIRYIDYPSRTKCGTYKYEALSVGSKQVLDKLSFVAR